MQKLMIKEDLLNSFGVIKKNKYLFSILFFTQLLFVFLISSIFAYYAVQVGEYAQKIVAPLQESIADETAIEQGTYALPTEIIENYNNMLKSALMFVLFAYLAYIMMNGVNWDLTNYIITRRENWIHYISYFALLTLVFTLPAMIIINSASKIFINFELIGATIILGALIAIIASYFMYISFSLVNHYRHNELKSILKHAYSIGMKKFWSILPAYLFMLIPLILLGVFSYFFQEGLYYFVSEVNLWIIFLAFGLVILYINWARLNFLLVMERVRQ